MSFNRSTPSIAQNRFERNYPRSAFHASSVSTISAQPSFENNQSQFDAPTNFSHRAVSPTFHPASHGQPDSYYGQPDSYYGQPDSYYGQPDSYGQPMARSSLLQRPQAGSQRDLPFPRPSYTSPVASMRGYPSPPSPPAAPYTLSPSHYHSQSHHDSSRYSQSSGDSSSLSRSHSSKHVHSTPRPLYSRQRPRSLDLSRSSQSSSSNTTNIIHPSSRYPTIIHPSEQSTIVKGKGGWVVVPPMGRNLIVLDVSGQQAKHKKQKQKKRPSLLFDL